MISKSYCAEKELDCKNLPVPTSWPVPSRIVSPYLPDELKKLAEKLGCEHKFDWDIYSECMFKENPPYAYGYLPGKKEDSAVFWCTKDKNKKYMFKKYSIVIYHKKKKPKDYNCPDIIHSKNRPSPLSVYNDSGETLEFFVNMSNPKKKLPKDTKLINNVIKSSTEDTAELFYCYNGEWVVRVLH
jgi:hypothetical protein